MNCTSTLSVGLLSLAALSINLCAADTAAPPTAAEGLGAMLRNVTPPPPPPPPAEKGDIQFNGIYLQLSSIAIGGRLVFTNTHYYFMPDGHVYYGMPPGGTVHPTPTPEDLAALMAAGANNFGTYKVTGKQLAMRFGKEPMPRMHTVELQKPGDTSVLILDGIFAVRYGQFKANQKLSGKYEAGNSIVTGGTAASGGGNKIYAASSSTINFHDDGTFQESSLHSFESSGKTHDTSSGGHGSDTGKYELSGNTLTLTYASGKTKSFTTYPMDEKNPDAPARMAVGSSIYTRQ